jgi:hypothetical protein
MKSRDPGMIKTIPELDAFQVSAQTFSFSDTRLPGLTVVIRKP